MSSVMIGVIGFLIMLVMMFLGFPIFVSMIGAAVFGFWMLTGPSMAIQQLTMGPFTMACNYSMVAMPMFLVLGVIAGEVGIGEGICGCLSKWMGRRKGGLLNATVVANCIFGACSGVPGAGNAVFVKCFTPELEKRGYERGNALAIITASGILSALIPPSLAIINFCILADLSMSYTLMCGLTGGIITTLVLIAMIKLMGIVNPEVMPQNDEGEKVPFIEKLKSLKLLLPVLLLFAAIIGGTSLGWFTATTGGAVGCLVVIVYAIFKRVPVRRLLNYIWDAVKMTGKMYPMIVAGSFFGRFIALSRLPQIFTDWIVQMDISRFWLFTMVVILYIICGCLMDVMSIIIITIPVVFPMLVAMGFSGPCLCIVLVLMTGIAGATPPVGNGVFMLASVADCEPYMIFKRVWPYVLGLTISAYVIAFCPSIVEFAARMIS